MYDEFNLINNVFEIGEVGIACLKLLFFIHYLLFILLYIIIYIQVQI